MYKKFLSAILFGTFLVTATGTFVSCKDYDDDIDNLQGQIDQIATSLGDLQNKVGSFVKSVTYDSAKGILTVVDNNGSSVSYTIAPNLPTYSMTVGADGTISLLKDNTVISTGKITIPAAFDASKFTIDASGKVFYNGVATSLVIPKTESFDPSKLTYDSATRKVLYNGTPTSIVLPSVETFDPSKLVVDSKSGKVLYNGTATSVVIPSDGVITLKDKKDANGATVGYSINYKGQSVSFGLNDILTLKSLVFKSDLFVNGIEAIEYPYMAYSQLKEVTSGIATNYTDDKNIACVVESPIKEWNYANGVAAEFDPIISINYHINPSSAKIEKEKLSFISRDVEAISRASVANPSVETLNGPSEGVINVGFKALGSKIATGTLENANSSANIMALQSVVKSGNKDTTIVSDYAMLYASKVIPQAIAYTDKTIEAENCSVTPNADELYKSVALAINNAPSLIVSYNGSIDLKTLLNIHYNSDSKTKNGGNHKIWKYGDEAMYGLKYDYALIDYKVGTNSTSDSKYASLNNGILTPSIVDANGATLNQQGVSSVGKRPLVRVRILDSQNKVVLYAFIKIEIVKNIGNTITSEFQLPKQSFGCDDLSASLTWSQISYQLLEKAAVQSKDEFDALYKFDVTGTNGNQYVSAGTTFNPATASQVIGSVIESSNSTGSTNTVLTWKLSMADQQKIYSMPNHTATIYVRYISKVNTTAHNPIYMPLSITIEKPQGSVITKLSNYWYNNLTNTRLNVLAPKDNSSTIDYSVNLNQVWEGNKPKFNAPASGFPSYTDAIFATQSSNSASGGYKYYFAAKQNTVKVGNDTYTLSVVNTKAIDITTGISYELNTENALNHALNANSGVFTNTTLSATLGSTTQTIATIDQNTGIITYANTDFAKILLNAFGHNEAAHFANIGVCAYTPCGVAFALTNAEYPAYFIRPIDPNSNNTGVFVDAEANGSTISLAKIFTFSDWRDVNFDNSNGWLYAFYGIHHVTVDLANVTTDLSGGILGTTKLSAKTSAIKLTQLDANGNVTTTGTHFDLSSYNSASQGSAAYNAVVAGMGKIKYENNGNNVQSFKLRIPVVFEYTWGQIRTFADVNVKGTLGN